MEKTHIDELNKNAAVIRQKLEEAVAMMDGEPLIVEYDNGGGQTGVRENPFFPAYEKLLKSYQSVLTQIEAAGGKVEAKPNAKLRVIGNSKWKRAVND